MRAGVCVDRRPGSRELARPLAQGTGSASREREDHHGRARHPGGCPQDQLHERRRVRRGMAVSAQRDGQKVPVVLEDGPHLHSTSGTTVTAGVLMLCTPDSRRHDARRHDNETNTGAPEPLRRFGGLPEYMALAGGKWKASTDRTGASGFLYRARTDIVVVSDGKTIDANRLAIPKDTTVDDRRGEAGRGANLRSRPHRPSHRQPRLHPRAVGERDVPDHRSPDNRASSAGARGCVRVAGLDEGHGRPTPYAKCGR